MTDAAAAPTTESPQTLRLFFALWPDQTTREALHRAGKWLDKHWGGRRMRAGTLHVTLAFLGETPRARLDSLIGIGDRIEAEPFDLVLDRVGYWRHNQIGWLGASAIAPQHIALVAGLSEALQLAGFPVDPRPHVPHVTLLRKSRGGETPACLPVRWPVDEFALVRSASGPQGACYEVLKRWPLRRQPTG